MYSPAILTGISPQMKPSWSNASSSVPGKIVIKRLLKGAYLASVKPDYSLTGKAVRYDCLVLPENR